MLFPGLVAFLVAAVLTPLLATWARRRNLLDIPNERSSHRVATPRLGGVAIVLALLAGLSITSLGGGVSPAIVVGAACALALVGLIDDVRPLPAVLRLVVQIGISILVASSDTAALPVSIPPVVAIALVALWMTAATNGFNFMDGIDGIAGVQAIAAGVGWALIGWISGSDALLRLGVLGAAAPAGFLLHNWAPARVFMGDGGSAFLGFFFSALPLVAAEGRPELWGCAALLLWPFLFDTAFTLLRRIRRGENILTPHRSHLYQRLTATGLGHARVATLYFALALIGVAAAVAVLTRQPVAGPASLLVLGAAALALWRYVVSREAAGPPMRNEARA